MKPLPISALIIALFGGGAGIVGLVVVPEQQTIAIAQSPSTGITWSELSDLFRRKRTRGGARGPFLALAPTNIAFCTQADSRSINKLWHPKPLFLWQGQATRIEVRRVHDSNDTHELIWEQVLKPEDNWVLYQGKPTFKPNVSYLWRLIGETDQVLSSHSFEVLERKERKQIRGDLKHINRQLQLDSNDEVSSEIVAWHRIQYFLQKNMLADAVWEIFQVKEPSADLQTLRQRLITHRPKGACP